MKESWKRGDIIALIGTLVAVIAIIAAITEPEIRTKVGLDDPGVITQKDTNDLLSKIENIKKPNSSSINKSNQFDEDVQLKPTNEDIKQSVQPNSNANTNNVMIQKLVDEARNQKETSIQAAYNGFQKAFLLLPDLHSRQDELKKIKKIYSFETQVEYLDSIFVSLKY